MLEEHISPDVKDKNSKLSSHARVVVIGGGVVGCSVLYHLTLHGWKDVVLLEKNELTSGSTWHAAGQCPQMMGSYNLAKIHLESNNLYKKLEKETGQPTGFHECGSLRIAYKKEDLDWFKYVKGILDNIGAPSDIISANEIKKVHCIKKGARLWSPPLNSALIIPTELSIRTNQLRPTGTKVLELLI